MPADPEVVLSQLLEEAVVWGDAAEWLPSLPDGSVDPFFTSPPYEHRQRTCWSKAFSTTFAPRSNFTSRGIWLRNGVVVLRHDG